MKSLRVEDRLRMVEKELAALQEIVSKNARGKDWRRTVGMFTGEADRLKARRLARGRRTDAK